MEHIACHVTGQHGEIYIICLKKNTISCLTSYSQWQVCIFANMKQSNYLCQKTTHKHSRFPTSLHSRDLRVADFVRLLNRRYRLVCLSRGTVHRLHPEGPLGVIFSGKCHIVTFLYGVEEKLSTFEFCKLMKNIQLVILYCFGTK